MPPTVRNSPAAFSNLEDLLRCRPGRPSAGRPDRRDCRARSRAHREPHDQRKETGVTTGTPPADGPATPDGEQRPTPSQLAAELRRHAGEIRFTHPGREPEHLAVIRELMQMADRLDGGI